ncbi:MAG: PQQ-binding-like beta-propeller repeat protein [Anaerolineae bacterium]
MTIWRSLVDRLNLARGMKLLRVFVPLLVLLLLASCGRGLRHESWPGLVVADDTLYAANLEHVQALNAETGKVYWSFPPPEDEELRPFYSTPVLASDEGEHGLLVVAGFSDQTVYGLALGASPSERPDELWRFQGASGQYVGTGTVADGLFLIGNGDGNVYAVDLEDGTEAWRFSTRDRVWATPVVVDDTVYVASLDHFLYALDLKTGAEQWHLEFAGSLSATPVYAQGDLWMGDFASTLYQVDLETHEVAWTFEARDWLWATPLVDGDILYFADVGGNVYALNITDHSTVWDAPVTIDDIIHGRPALNPDGSLLYVAGYEKGLLYAIETASGSMRESWGTTPENPGRLPGDLVADDERLYTMPILVQKRVEAFGLSNGELLWSEPQAAE